MEGVSSKICNGRGFKQDCPDGQLSKEKILEMYTMILPAGNAKVKISKRKYCLKKYSLSTLIFVAGVRGADIPDL